MQICGVVGAHRSGAELSFIKWHYYTSHISKIKIKLKSVCWSIESITLTVYSLGVFFFVKKLQHLNVLSQRYFFRFCFFLSRCFPLTSFHLAISDVYFACVFILQRNVCEFDVLWWLGLIATCHFLPFRQISFAIVFWCHKFHSLSIPRTVFYCVLLSAVVKFCPFSSFSFIQYDSVMVTTLSSYQNMQSVHERHNVFFAAHILFSI